MERIAEALETNTKTLWSILPFNLLWTAGGIYLIASDIALVAGIMTIIVVWAFSLAMVQGIKWVE